MAAVSGGTVLVGALMIVLWSEAAVAIPSSLLTFLVEEMRPIHRGR